MKHIVFHLTSIILGLINCLYHHWSDWEIGILTSEAKGYELHDFYYKKEILFSSLYGPLITDQPSVFIIQILTLIVISGYSCGFLIKKLYQKQSFKIQLIFFTVFWLLKYPIIIELSTYQGLYRALLAW